MITKHLKSGMGRKLLNILFHDYLDEYGPGVRNLSQFPVLITSSDIYLKRMPELREQDEFMVRYLFLDVMKELEQAGYVEYDKKTAFFLTTQGYMEASKTRVQRFLDFCNKNEGLAVPISIFSLIVAFIALFTGH